MPDPTPRENHAGMTLGVHLHGKGLTAADVENMSTDELAGHARQAGMGRKPSDGVRTAATAYMKRLAAPKLDDPFAGL